METQPTNRNLKPKLWPVSAKSSMSTSDKLTIKVKKLHAAAQLPLRGSTWAAGADLHCVEAFMLQPGERKAVPTGLAVEIPPGFYGRVAPRSGWAAKHGIDTLAGIIDA